MKQIALATSLLISSTLLWGASYDLLNEQQNDFSDLKTLSPLDNILDGPFSNIDLFGEQDTAYKKQAYLDALDLMRKNQLGDAENKISGLLKQYPEVPAFYNLQALLETSRTKYDLAIKSYQKAIELNQKNFKAHLGLAWLFLRANDLPQAKEYANISLSINDKSIRAYILLADITNKQNNQQNSENLLLTAQKKIQGNIEQELAVANYLVKLYAAQKKPEKTLSLAHDIITRYPENKAALSFLASVRLLNNQKQQAIQTLEQLIQLEKKDINHRLLLAKLLVNQPENKQKVLKLLNEVTVIAPDNLPVLIQKTAFLIELNHLLEATNTTKQIKQLSPKTGVGELLQGDIYLAEKKPDQALASYQKSYKIKPNSKLLDQITNMLITQGKQSGAIDFLNKELKETPKNLLAHFKLASIYDQQKNINKAEKHYKTILAEQPDNAQVLNNLAWLYYQQNNPKALPFAKKAYQKAPKSAAVADTYASILVKQGELAEGIKILEKASKQAPLVYDIHYHLANAYALDGKHEQATKILQAIVKSKQNFSEKNAAHSLLKKLENK